MNKKIVAIVVLTLVILVGAATALYVFMNDRSPVDRQNDSNIGVNKDEHIGVAKVVTKQDIASAFGGDTKVGDVEQSGTVTIDTQKMETATYKVQTTKGEVTFDVNAITYESKEALQASDPFVGAEKAKVDGVGEEAHYFIPFGQDIFKDQQVALITIKDKTSYKFAIVQNSDDIKFSADEAKPILLEVAKKAKLEEVK